MNLLWVLFTTTAGIRLWGCGLRKVRRCRRDEQPGPDSFGSRCSSAVAMSRNVPLIILDPLYSTHDQDENDTRAMAGFSLTPGCDRVF